MPLQNCESREPITICRAKDLTNFNPCMYIDLQFYEKILMVKSTISRTWLIISFKYVLMYKNI